MSDDAPELGRLQRWMQAVITHPAGVAARVRVRRGPPGDRGRRPGAGAGAHPLPVRCRPPTGWPSTPTRITPACWSVSARSTRLWFTPSGRTCSTSSRWATSNGIRPGATRCTTWGRTSLDTWRKHVPRTKTPAGPPFWSIWRHWSGCTATCSTGRVVRGKTSCPPSGSRPSRRRSGRWRGWNRPPTCVSSSCGRPFTSTFAPCAEAGSGATGSRRDAVGRTPPELRRAPAPADAPAIHAAPGNHCRKHGERSD